MDWFESNNLVREEMQKSDLKVITVACDFYLGF